MNISRVKPVIVKPTQNNDTPTSSSRKLEDFIDQRDYVGAITFLQYTTSGKSNDLQTKLWIAFCNFRLGKYKDALNVNNILLNSDISFRGGQR